MNNNYQMEVGEAREFLADIATSPLVGRLAVFVGHGDEFFNGLCPWTDRLFVVWTALVREGRPYDRSLARFDTLAEAERFAAAVVENLDPKIALV